ncbi:HAMP domain-containing sensor histidine kinase [Streptomyces sp. NPDC050704]|uniref:sensor histidine kinase n=1 Tax=Streptomyces sp. NPDC050704 TaxID=3157219 RepID=UPI003434DB39
MSTSRRAGLRAGLYSLRVRLSIANVILLALTLTLTITAGLLGVRHFMLDRIDEELLRARTNLSQSGATVESVENLLRLADHLHSVQGFVPDNPITENTTVVLDPSGRPLPVVEPVPAGRAAQTVSTQRGAVASAVADPAALSDAGDPVTVEAGGRDYRVVAVRLQDGGMILQAASLDSMASLVTRLLPLSVGTGLGLLLTLAAVSLATARRSLRPLEDMVHTASAIAEGDLSRRMGDEGSSTTEVVELRDALNTMLHQIESAFETRERATARARQFAADASHELRTPLTAVRGYLQLCADGMLGEADQRRALNRASTEADRMGHLVDELLDLARLDQRPLLDLRRVDLARLARDGAADLAARQPRRPVVVRAPGTAVYVLGDEDRLRLAVGKLLANVRTHTPESARAEVSVEADAGTVRLRVADHGPGMRSEDAARIFDRFFRADAGRRRDTDGADGTGLGLSIVRAVAEVHSGTVELDTAPGEGLSVTLRLPTGPAAAG